ncbi:O-antigen ligase family protein [Pelagerythrobacter marensis]|uniref:O-antigen ligase family protein n=1 Tax=Pelagerythrobacter marensis TaxID=543877 RepID=A0ABZ2D4A3_9SPHN
MSHSASQRRRASEASSKRGMLSGIFSADARLIVLAAFLLLVFLTGGSSRADMPSLAVLRPVSILVLGYALLTLSREHLLTNRAVALIAAAAMAMALLHLLPLPPEIWRALPGREGIAAIDSALGFTDAWRPLTLDPQATRNALMALVVPCAVFALAIQLTERGRETMLTVVLALGALTAVWAVLQLMGSPRGPLYLYSLTNYGAPVGLFANRNHQAVFLASLIPLVFCWALRAEGAWSDMRSARGRRGGIAIACTLLFVPLVLIGGSRAGLLALLLSICATAAIAMAISGGERRNGKASRNRGSRKRSRHGPARRSAIARFAPALAAVVVVAGLGLLTIGMGRDRAFERLVGSDPIDDLRGDILPVVWDIAIAHFPWGTGLGSFDDVFRSFEPDALLTPSYINHAHNDFVEIFMTGGLPGLAILFAALAVLAARAWAVLRRGRQGIREDALPAGALIALILLLIASLVDYPLRTPALAGYAVLLALWAGRTRSAID